VDQFELPDDITALNDEEFSALLEGSFAAFDAKSNASQVIPDDLAQLRR
jgi:hypothetical protein